MRRSDREITDENKKIAVLENSSTLYLAMNDADQGIPYLVAVSYGMKVCDGKVLLYFHCAGQGKKVDLLSRDPRVRFFANHGEQLVYDKNKKQCTMNYESVSGIGTVKEIETENKKHALDLLMKHYYPRDVVEYDEKMIEVTRVYCLHVEEMTAKKRDKVL